MGFSPGMELFDMVNSPPVPQLDSPVAPAGHRPISSQVGFCLALFNYFCDQ